MPGQGRMWHKELCRLVNFYNTVKPHYSLNGDTSFEILQASFSTCGVNNTMISYKVSQAYFAEQELDKLLSLFSRVLP